MHTPEESGPARRRGRSARRAAKAGLAVAGALLLAAAVSASSPAGAAVKPAATAAKAVLAATASASAIPTCDTGIHNNYEYYTDCTAGTYYYRTVAECQDGNLALGAEELGSSRKVSVSDCEQDSDLNSANDWGLLYCSNNSGNSDYEGYLNESTGDISQFLSKLGNGVIATGGAYMCDVFTNASNVIADVAPTPTG